MVKTLFAIGTAFLRAFGVTFLFMVTGLLAAPNLASAEALALSAFIASLVAGLRAAQVLFPQITWAGIIKNVNLAAMLDSATRSGLTAFVVFVTGWFLAPDWSAWKSALVGLGIAVGTAVVRAIQGFFTPGEWPVPSFGYDGEGILAKRGVKT